MTILSGQQEIDEPHLLQYQYSYIRCDVLVDYFLYRILSIFENRPRIQDSRSPSEMKYLNFTSQAIFICGCNIDIHKFKPLSKIREIPSTNTLEREYMQVSQDLIPSPFYGHCVLDGFLDRTQDYLV